MTSKILKKFVQDMKTSGIMKQEGSFSPFVFGGILPGGFKPYINKYYDFDYNSFLFIFKENHGTIFFDPKIYFKCTIETYKHFKNSKDNKLLEFTSFQEIWKKTDEYYKKYKPELLESLSNKELDKVLKDSFNLTAEILASTVFSESLDSDLVKIFFDELNTKSISFEDFFKTASKSTFESLLAWRDRLLVENYDKDPYELQWLFCDYNDVPSISDMPKVIREVIKEKGGIKVLKQDYKKLSNEAKKNKQEVEEFSKNLESGLKKLVDFMQLTMYTRDIRRVSIQKSFTLASNISRILFPRLGLPDNLRLYTTIYDILNGSYLKKDFIKELEKRTSGLALYYNKNGSILEYDNVEAIKEGVYDVMDVDKNLTEIKGNIGCKGYSKARAKIILSQKDFHKLNEGEILVTSMTRPEFIPLMKKASAIVTDEGGITCHAAIVSREMNKPCVIGTKNASRILKDNDLVEVDANKGVVRIIEKAKAL